MQNLDIISVNFWQIVISLCNLVLLYLLLKRFLYKPVARVLAQRQAAVDQQYANADAARDQAQQLKQQWEDKIAGADDQAQAILHTAAQDAQLRADALLAETQAKAERILQQAQTDVALERSKAEAGIKKQIVEVSAALSEKMIGRAITPDDHRQLIDDFLAEIGDTDDHDQ